MREERRAPQRRSRVGQNLGKIVRAKLNRLQLLKLMSSDSEPKAGLGQFTQSTGECSSYVWLGKADAEE
jgi:hypothetical protein